MVRTRFAPSPTGFLHFGSLRAILFPYLHTRSNNGQFILRIDNTDSERSKDIYIDDIKDQLKWLKVSYDSIFFQKERSNLYEEIFHKLEGKDLIYECFETPEELQEIRERKLARKIPPLFTINDRKSKKQGQSHWRFQLPDIEYKFNDIIYKDLKSTKQWSDPIIKKQNGEFTYIFASVVDDLLMNITTIIRGADHLNNTFIQKAIGDAISMTLEGKEWGVEFAHFPLINDETGHKISKRIGGSTLKELSYLEPQTLWSITTSLGTSKPAVISGDYEDYVENFNLHDYSVCNQVLRPKALIQLNKKILPQVFCPENRDLFELLKPNLETREDFYSMERCFSLFNLDDSFYEMVESKDYFGIYQKCFGKNYGPRIADLIDYIKTHN